MNHTGCFQCHETGKYIRSVRQFCTHCNGSGRIN
jgi:DnaJ-class molecular chaperone